MVVVCCLAFLTIESPRASAARLPGARAEINAADYPSLQSALDALPAEGGVVRIPPGRFEIEAPLVITNSDVLLQGAGASTQIVNANRSGRPALVLQHPDGRRVKNDDRLWRIMLSNFRLTGNDASGHGIEAVRIQEVFIQGVTVSKHGGHGILLDHCYEDPRINDCLITYNKMTGLQLVGCHDIVVSGNQFEENRDAVQCIDSFNLCMTGNNLDDHLRHGVVIENTYGSVISGNMIEECKGTAVILDRDCYGNTISANVIAHNGLGIDLIDAHGCAVSANTFTINTTYGLRIGPASGRITVTGNNFSNSYIGDGKLKRGANDLAAGGLHLDGTRHIAISGNLFAGVRPKALETAPAASTRNVLFSNNVVVDAASDHERLDNSLTEPNLNESNDITSR